MGLALLVVLEELTPQERLSFVLHDMFGIPFSEIAQVVERSPDAARQLASRARRRFKGAAPRSDADLDRQREVAEAFVSASRDGDFEALLSVLAPDVVLRVDQGPRGSLEIRGAREVAAQARTPSRTSPRSPSVLVNGAPGYVVIRDGRPVSVGAFTVADGKITEMDLLADPRRLAELDLTGLDD